uniref:Uncharacterized protein n=1 Tax=Meloidogyne enterolobii TaxID=390850 RepID=A0A6V7VLN4_MELEN|nr:unnamed protein product [Meloidogyne enterolobii]
MSFGVEVTFGSGSGSVARDFKNKIKRHKGPFVRSGIEHKIKINYKLSVD